jgi:carbonic anhydrase/acetyltransferase-like protein (isoleucine patch superfamily)
VAELRLDPTAFIAPSAHVSGSVTLGPRSSVWFGTVVRGDTAAIEIGEASNVQDNSVVHVDLGFPARIGARVTVGHRAIVHGCTIGDDCLIGMGAVVLTGATIGPGSLIGAASLVREGQVIPPGSLAVGSPARVVGPAGPSHRAAIEDGSSHYAGLALDYMRRGFARPHPLPTSDRGTAGVRREPMTHVEWGRLLRVMREGPAQTVEKQRVAGERWGRNPGPGRWSAHEIVCHLRDIDREIYQPRVEQLLAEREPRFENVDPTPWSVSRGYAGEDPAAALAGWSAARERLVATLSPLRNEHWLAFAWHSKRGPYPLGSMVRDWAEHDLSHRQQMARALREAG